MSEQSFIPVVSTPLISAVMKLEVKNLLPFHFCYLSLYHWSPRQAGYGIYGALLSLGCKLMHSRLAQQLAQIPKWGNMFPSSPKEFQRQLWQPGKIGRDSVEAQGHLQVFMGSLFSPQLSFNECICFSLAPFIGTHAPFHLSFLVLPSKLLSTPPPTPHLGGDSILSLPVLATFSGVD